MSTRQYEPFGDWTETSRTSPLIIAILLLLMYEFALVAVQQTLHYKLTRGFTWHDGLLIAGMTLAFVQATLLFVGVSKGLGKSASVIRIENLPIAETMYKTSNVFYVLTLGSIKCSAVCFTASLKTQGRRIETPSLRQAIPFHGCLGLAITWTIGSVAALSCPCKAYGGHANNSGMCMGTVPRWIGVFIGDAITDIVVVVYSAVLLWPLRASIGTRIRAFVPSILRGMVPISSGLRLLAIDQRKLTQDPTFALWLFAVLSQVQILVSVLSAASTIFKSVLDLLATNWGDQTESNADLSQQTSSVVLKRLTRRTQNSSSPLQLSGTESRSRWRPFSGPEGSINHSAVSGKRYDRTRRDDGDSQKGIIRQDDYTVSYLGVDDDGP